MENREWILVEHEALLISPWWESRDEDGRPVAESVARAGVGGTEARMRITSAPVLQPGDTFATAWHWNIMCGVRQSEGFATSRPTAESAVRAVAYRYLTGLEEKSS